MALELIKISEFPQVNEPSEWIAVADANGIAYKISKADFKEWLGTVQTIVPKAISPTDPAPTLPGIYRPTVSGTYGNLGGLVIDNDGKLNEVLFDGVTFVNVVTPLPMPDLVSTIQPTEINKAVNGKAVADYVDIKQNGGFIQQDAPILTQGFYKTIHGSDANSSIYQYSDFLPVSKGDRIEITVESVNSGIPIALLYNNNNDESFDSVIIVGSTSGVVTRDATILKDGFVVINNKRDNGQVIIYKKYQESTVAKKSELENYVIKPVLNKLLNPRKYGVSFINIASPLVNLFYNKDIKAWQNGSQSNVVHFTKTLIPVVNQGKYFGLVVNAGQTLTYFRTETASPVTTVDNFTRVSHGDKDILYLDISKTNVDRVLLQIASGTPFTLYNIFTTDTIDFVTLPDNGVTVVDEDSDFNPYYWDLVYRKNETPKFFASNNYSPSGRFTYYDPSFWKRYLFFDVDTSFPALRHTVFLVGVHTTSLTTFLARAVLVPGEGFMLDIGENYTQAKGIALTQKQIGQSDSFVQLKNIRVSDSKSLTTKGRAEIPSFETSYEAKDIGLDLFRVGDTIFTGKAPEFAGRDVDYKPNGWSDVSMYEYTGKKISTKETVSKLVVDTADRHLIGVYEDVLWFKNETTNKVEKISFEDFLESLELHNLNGRSYTDLTYLELPEGSTDVPAKQALYAKMTQDWRMVGGGYSPEIFDIPNTSLETQTFANGNILSGTTLIKQDGTSYKPKLKNPIACNPARVLVYDSSDVLIQDIDLSTQESDVKWGLFAANQGAITYTEDIKAGINFINGKTINVGISLNAGNYRLVWRCRRYGTYTTQTATIEVSAVSFSDEILLDSRGSVGELIDYELMISLPSSVTSLNFSASCESQIDLALGNGASSIGTWGRQCRGKFGTIAEYASAPNRRSGAAYLTQDYGETFEAIFDMSLNTLMRSWNGYHLHGATYDPVWNQMILVNGDNDPNRPFLIADINKDTTIDNVEWRLPQNHYVSEYILLRGEQYCSVFADNKAIYYGTDYSISGVFRMNRIEKNLDTKREPCFIVQSNNTLITHIPTEWYKDENTGEVFSYFILGDNPEAAEWEYETHLIASTIDGITWREVWKDDVRRSGFSQSVFTRMYKIGDYLVCQTFLDNRFTMNRSVLVMKYK